MGGKLLGFFTSCISREFIRWEEAEKVHLAVPYIILLPLQWHKGGLFGVFLDVLSVSQCSSGNVECARSEIPRGISFRIGGVDAPSLCVLLFMFRKVSCVE